MTTPIHVTCVSQKHTSSNVSEKQIASASIELSPSAAYLKKLVEGISKGEDENDDSGKAVQSDSNTSQNTESIENSTVAVHADASYEDVLIGLSEYDSKDVDTHTYSAKREAYDNVRKRYPSLDTLVREEKIKALKELKSVGFTYYTTKVKVFIKKDGLTYEISSKSHHSLEKPSIERLQFILQSTFNGTLRTQSSTSSGKSEGDDDDLELSETREFTEDDDACGEC